MGALFAWWGSELASAVQKRHFSKILLEPDQEAQWFVGEKRDAREGVCKSDGNIDSINNSLVRFKSSNLTLTVDLRILFLLIRIYTLPTPRPSSSDPLPKDIEAIRNRNHSCSQESKDANAPPYAKIVQHR